MKIEFDQIQAALGGKEILQRQKFVRPPPAESMQRHDDASALLFF